MTDSSQARTISKDERETLSLPVSHGRGPKPEHVRGKGVTFDFVPTEGCVRAVVVVSRRGPWAITRMIETKDTCENAGTATVHGLPHRCDSGCERYRVFRGLRLPVVTYFGDELRPDGTPARGLMLCFPRDLKTLRAALKFLEHLTVADLAKMRPEERVAIGQATHPGILAILRKEAR